MKENLTSKDRGIQLKGIVITERVFKIPKISKEQEGLHFNHNINVDYSKEPSTLLASVKIETISNLPGFEISLSFDVKFHLDEMEDFLVGDELPVDLQSDLNRIIVGLSRGLLCNLFSGTALRDVYIPILPDIELS